MMTSSENQNPAPSVPSTTSGRCRLSGRTLESFANVASTPPVIWTNKIPIKSIPAKISTEYRLSVQAMALSPPDQMYRIMTRKNSRALIRHGISPLVAISMMMPPPRN